MDAMFSNGRDVLQIPSTPGWFINTAADPFSSNLLNIINPKPLKLGTWHFEQRYTSLQMSHVMCQVSHVKCHMSCVIWKRGVARRWRIYYQRGLPRQVFSEFVLLEREKRVVGGLNSTNVSIYCHCLNILSTAALWASSWLIEYITFRNNLFIYQARQSLDSLRQRDIFDLVLSKYRYNQDESFFDSLKLLKFPKVRHLVDAFLLMLTTVALWSRLIRSARDVVDIGILRLFPIFFFYKSVVKWIQF